MEEIKVGDFVRTYQGDIGKVQTVTSTGIIIEDERHIHFDRVTKRSPNIIDLIEVRDYVNGYFVIITDNAINDDGEKVILTENYDDWTDNGVVLNKDIKTIVTHEQFDTIRYEVI